jgi:dihydrofolate reductase
MATDTIAYVAVSLDGYIAGDGGTVDFLESYGSEEFDFHGFMSGISGLVMGAKTYEQIVGWGWPYGELPGLVLTNRELPIAEGASIEFGSGNTGDEIMSYAARTSGRVWVVGGGRVIVDGMNAGAIDLLEIYVMPVTLGSGVALFPDVFTGTLTLDESRAFSNGVVMLRYNVSL